MAETIMWLPEKQGEPPASQLAGGPKGWMLGHGPAPCVLRHMGQLSSYILNYTRPQPVEGPIMGAGPAERNLCLGD